MVLTRSRRRIFKEEPIGPLQVHRTSRIKREAMTEEVPKSYGDGDQINNLELHV